MRFLALRLFVSSNIRFNYHSWCKAENSVTFIRESYGYINLIPSVGKEIVINARNFRIFLLRSFVPPMLFCVTD